MLSRDDFLDFAKGILITLVLLGHCIQYLSGDIYYSNTMYYSNWLMKYIYSFHMPMFIYISGYLTFFSIKKRGRVATFLQRIKRLSCPIIVWTCINMMIGIIRGKKQLVFFDCFEVWLSTLWFLHAIIIFTAYVCFFDTIKKRISQLTVLLLTLVLMTVSPDIYWVHAYKFTFPFFILGYLMAKNKKDYMLSRNVLWIMPFVLLLFGYRDDVYVYVSGFSIFHRGGVRSIVYQIVYIDLYRFLVGLVGIIAMLAVWKKTYFGLQKFTGQLSFENEYVGSIFKRLYLAMTYLGKNSLAFYVISTFLFGFLSIFTRNAKPSLLVWAIETIVVLSVCDFTMRIIKRSKLLARLFLGE